MAFEPGRGGTDGNEAAQAGGCGRQAAAGGRVGRAGAERGRRDPRPRRDGGDVLPLAQEFGGLKTDQVRRMKDLDVENQRLRKAVADLTLDKLILKEAARGNF